MKTSARPVSLSSVVHDLTSGGVVFLVALPLCLGIALASKASGLPDAANANLFAGLVAGIVGGIVVGALSGSHTSVSGPAAGLTAIVAAQIANLGSFQAFLLAVVIAGVFQVALGVMRAGALAAFFPSSVINGLLAAIGVILILKQIPHLLGHDTDPEGEMSFDQPDHETTFSEIGTLLGGDIHPGAIVIGVVSLTILLLGGRWKRLKQTWVPLPLVVVVLGVALCVWFERLGGRWVVEASHLVQVPVANSLRDLAGFLQFPDFSQWTNPRVYQAAVTIAIVASLETLLNLEAVDRLDPLRRHSPPSRELWSQGIGNIVAGFVGGLPVTSVIVRGSVNINAGARSRLSAIFHGVLLLSSVALLPTYLNKIPLSCLAAILLDTGLKLASPGLFKRMWLEGRYQFAPFIITLAAIVLTDLLVGILIGLAISLAFILNSNVRRPLRRVMEKHVGCDVLRIELANQVSFLNRASLEHVLLELPRGAHVLLDASESDYIDPDVLSLIRDFKDQTGPAHGVQVSLRGFRTKYQLHDDILYVDYSTREIQGALAPAEALQVLVEGNERFRTGQRLHHDFGRQRAAAASGQYPLAVVLSCIDSRTPAELIFDLGLGDIFSVRIAGNGISPKVLGSIEYGCAVAGSKLVLVVGHTQCGAVTASVDMASSGKDPEQVTGCEHLNSIVSEIQRSVDAATCRQFANADPADKSTLVDAVAQRNVLRTVDQIVSASRKLGNLVEEKQIAVVGAMYDVGSGKIDFYLDDARGALASPKS